MNCSESAPPLRREPGSPHAAPSAAVAAAASTRPAAPRPWGWLLFVGASVAMALIFMSLGRGAGLMATVLVVGATWGATIWRRQGLGSLLDSLETAWTRPAIRALFVLGATLALALLLIRLNLFFSRLLILGLIGVLLLLAIRHPRVQTLRRDLGQSATMQSLIRSRALHWLLFVGAAAVIGYWLTVLPAPYPPLIMGILLVAILPGLYARARGHHDDPAALMLGAGLAALLLAILTTHAFLNETEYSFENPLRILVLGAGALGLAIYAQHKAGLLAVLPVPSDQALTPLRLNRWDTRVFGAGFVLLLIFTEANGRILKLPPLDNMNVHLQFALLILSVTLMSAGLSALRWPGPIHISWRTVLIVSAITALALFLRFWQLEDALRQFVDELNFAAVVDGFWNHPTVPLMKAMSGIAAFPFLYPYWQSMAVNIFGTNLVGLRAVSAMLGTLTIPAVYLLGKAAFDRKTGLIAALLLATFPPHLHFSRLALNNIADPLAATLGLAFVVRGLRYQRRVDYVLGGVCLGFTHYFYEGGRLIFTPLLLLWLAGLVYLWFPRLPWRHLLIVGLTLVLIALPIYYTLMANNNSVATRLIDNDTALNSSYWNNVATHSQALDEHVRFRVLKPIMLFIRDVDGSYFYRGVNGLMIPLLVPLFMLGMGYALFRLRYPGPLLLILWWLMVVGGNSLMMSADHTPRYVVAFPALMLTVAVGLRYTLALVWPESWWPRARTPLLFALAIGIAAYQANYYFNIHLPVYKNQTRLSAAYPDSQETMWRSLDFPPHTVIFLISDVEVNAGYLHGALHYMRDDLDLEGVTTSQVSTDFLKSLSAKVDYAFFIEPGHQAIVNLLKRYFYLLPPQYSSDSSLPESLQFTLYYAPYLPEYSEKLRARLDRTPPRDFPRAQP